MYARAADFMDFWFAAVHRMIRSKGVSITQQYFIRKKGVHLGKRNKLNTLRATYIPEY